MRRAFALFCGASLFILSAHRLPAPIVETPKIISNPAPKYPAEARSGKNPVKGEGRYRVVFNANGGVKDVQVVESTGHKVLDEAAIKALRQWRSEPNDKEWVILVPISFAP